MISKVFFNLVNSVCDSLCVVYLCFPVLVHVAGSSLSVGLVFS